MKPSKALPAETKDVCLSEDQYATVHHPGESAGPCEVSWRWRQGGSNTILGVFSCVSPWRDRLSCFSIFLSTWLPWLICFRVESECTVSTFLQRRDDSALHTAPLRYPPWGESAQFVPDNTSVTIYWLLHENILWLGLIYNPTSVLKFTEFSLLKWINKENKAVKTISESKLINNNLIRYLKTSRLSSGAQWSSRRAAGHPHVTE